MFFRVAENKGSKASTSDVRPIIGRCWVGKKATLDQGMESLWEAFSRHGVSDHMLRVLQCIYYAHMGDKSIRMCVPRIASESGNPGVDFQDGKRTLLDLRFAADIILFAKMFEETQFFAGRTGDTFGPSGATIECTKNKNLDNPVSQSEQITSNRSV